jgi:exodeoxyribonuclease VII small subunit
MEKRNFESSLKELESIVEKLEKGEISLEESLGLYEQGITLVKFCNSQLNAAEKKIEILQKELDSQMKAVPFEENDTINAHDEEKT